MVPHPQSLSLGYREVKEDVFDVPLDNMLTTLSASPWPSGILLYMVYFQGIFPVWTRGRKRREKDLI